MDFANRGKQAAKFGKKYQPIDSNWSLNIFLWRNQNEQRKQEANVNVDKNFFKTFYNAI